MLVVGLGVLLCMGVSYWMGVSGRLAERIAELRHQVLVLQYAHDRLAQAVDFDSADLRKIGEDVHWLSIMDRFPRSPATRRGVRKTPHSKHRGW
jgi:hypothetical protein